MTEEFEKKSMLYRAMDIINNSKDLDEAKEKLAREKLMKEVSSCGKTKKQE